MTLTQLDYYVRINNQSKYWYIIDKSTFETDIYINEVGENAKKQNAKRFKTEFEAQEQIIVNGWENWACVSYE